MARFKEIPGATLKASLALFCAEQEEIPLLPVLGTRAIAEEMDHRHRWMTGLYVVQYWVKMLPDCRGTFFLGL